MFVSVLFVQALIAVVAVALPSSLSAAAKRDTATTKPALVPVPLNAAPLDGTHIAAAQVDNSIHAGVGVFGSESEFRSVTVNFDLPVVRSPAGNPFISRAIPVAAFDLAAGCPSFLIAGVQMVALSTEGASYLPFYQWAGEVTALFDEVQLSANDEVSVTLQATNRTHAVATISKNGNDQFQRVTLNFPNTPLCLAAPGWFVSSLPDEPVANFGDVILDRPSATNTDGTETVGPLDPRAEVFNIVRGNTRLTEIGRGAQSVSVRYTGE